MVLIILFFIIFIFILFLVYKFYTKLDAFIKQFLKSQRVMNIKAEMKHLDNKILNANIKKVKSEKNDEENHLDVSNCLNPWIDWVRWTKAG